MTVVKRPIPLAHRYPIFRNGLCFLIDVFIKADSSLAQWNTILWAARPCDAGSDLREIDFDDLVVAWLRLRWIVPQALHTGVVLDQTQRVASCRLLQVLQRLRINGEEAHGGAILRRHVGNRSTRGEGQAGQRSEEPTSELQSLMGTSYALFCLQQK